MKRKNVMKDEKKRLNRKTTGFTLVELIVVLVILSILSAVAVPALTGYIDNGKAKECKAKVEALAVEVASAKMASEINGVEDEDGSTATLNVQNYINTTAGENGKCPQGDTYLYESNRIKCPIHDVSVEIPNSGKFTVAVAEPERESEIKVETPPTPESESPTPKEKSYTATVSPGSLNMETGGEQNLSVGVVEVVDGETGELLPPGSYTVEWHYPSYVTMDDPNSPTPKVYAKEAGTGGEIYCTVTVDGKTVESNHVGVTVMDPEPDLHLEVGDLEVEANKGGNLNAWASDGKGGNYPGNVGFTYTCDNPNLTVDENGNVTSDVPGEYTVTVTVTDASDSNKTDSKTVTITVKGNEEKNGGVLKGSAELWAEDHGDDSTYNLEKDAFASWFIEPPTGQYGRWDYLGNDDKVVLMQQNSVDVHGQIHWEAGRKYVLTYTPPGGEPEEIVLTVGYSLAQIENISLNPGGNNLAVGERKNVSAPHQPKKTTDEIEWEIVKPDETEFPAGEAPAKLDVIDSENAQLTALSSGQFKIHVFCHRKRYLGTDKEILERYSDVITVGEGSGNTQQQETQNQSENQAKVTDIALNPSSMTLEVGQSKQLEVLLTTDGDIDMDKLTCSFAVWGSSCVSVTPSGQVKNIVTLTGTETGGTRIGVQVQYNNGWVGQRECEVTVVEPQTETETEKESLPENEVEIDGKRFGATSWEEFRKRVEDKNGKSYKVNYRRGQPDGDTTILLYDVDKETGERILYVVKGNEEDFKTTTTPVGYDSFADFIKGNNLEKKFTKVSFSPENIICIESYDELKTAAEVKGGYPEGTIVKVKNTSGGYDYYIAYDSGDRKTQLSSILYGQTSEEAKNNNGWWKLEVLS